MKVQQLMLIVSMSCFFALFTQAQSTDSTNRMMVKVEKQTDQSIRVKLANLENVRTEVSITDLHGKVWFSEYVWGEHGYAKMLNLSTLTDGTYTVLVRNKMKTVVQAIEKKAAAVYFYEAEKTSVAKLTSSTDIDLLASIEAVNNHAVTVRLANLDQADAVIQLYHINGIVMMKEKIQQRNGYAKKINVADLQYGTYGIAVHTKQLQFVQWIKLTKEGIVAGKKQVLNVQPEESKIAIR